MPVTGLLYLYRYLFLSTEMIGYLFEGMKHIYFSPPKFRPVLRGDVEISVDLFTFIW
jgi:hypothetical protein